MKIPKWAEDTILKALIYLEHDDLPAVTWRQRKDNILQRSILLHGN